MFATPNKSLVLLTEILLWFSLTVNKHQWDNNMSAFILSMEGSTLGPVGMQRLNKSGSTMLVSGLTC